MADSNDAEKLFWVDPDTRGIIPLDNFHVPRSLKKTIRNNTYEIRYNYDFEGVIKACAEKTKKRSETWINHQIMESYRNLFFIKHAHTVECWMEDELVGGLYGVSIGGAFFGESMFSRKDDASKVALVYLVVRLKRCGFVLLDTQFSTKHLEQFGTKEITREAYQKLLGNALYMETFFYCKEFDESDDSILRRILQPKTQTS